VNVLDRLDTTLRVVGGARLEGSVEVQGAKNAALPIMAAALLARGKVTLHRVPRITDVSVMWSLLEALGARVALEDRNSITIDASNVNKFRAPYTLVRKLAASFDLCGPVAPRCRCRAAASSARAPPTCTRQHSARSMPTSPLHTAT
jgi:UDP-N-acetylglucosamine enolpyruvyl transferase